MKKLLKNSFTLLLTCCILVSMLCLPALAANGNIYISSASAEVGGNASISVAVGDAISMCDILLSYDSSKLEYISGSGSGMDVSGGGGTIHINGYNGTGAGSFSCSLTFKAIAAGSAGVSVSYHDMVDDNGDNVVGSVGSATITITNPPTASSDADLVDMSISPGSLSPSFSSGTTSYSATVSSSTTQLSVYAQPSDDNATVTVSNRNLSVGSNTINVTVTAEDGTTKVYSISVTRPAGTTAPPTTGGNTGGNTGSGNTGGNTPATTPETDVPEAPTEAYISLIGGSILEVSETIDEDEIPEGFILTETTVEGFTVDAIIYGENADPAVWLLGDDNNPEGFYFINEDGFAYPMVTLTQPEIGFIVTDITSYEIPDGYILGKFTIDETEYDVFIKDDGKEPDHCLIYGINEKGETVLYCYDPAEGTFQKHGIASVVEVKEVVKEVEVEVIKEVEVPVEVPVEPEDDSLLSIFKDKRVFWIGIGIAVVLLALIVLCIMLGIMYSRKSKACQHMIAKRNYHTEPLPTIED